jgi:hypothetical protein
MRRKLRIVLGFASYMLAGCSVDGTNWDVEGTAPVVETRLDLTNLIGADNLSTNPDSAINIAIDVPLYTLNVDTLSNLPLAKSVYGYVWTYPTLTLPGGAGIPGLTSSLDLTGTDIRLSRFDIEHGKLRCTLKSTLTQPLIFHYYIPKVTKGGLMLEFTDTLPGRTSGIDTVVFVRDFAVDDYQIDLTGDLGDDFNSLTAWVDVQTITGNPGVLITNGQTVFKTETEIIELTPGYAKGYLGQYSFNQANSNTNFSELQMVRSGLVDVENINLNLSFHNTIGADISFSPTEIKATNTRTGQMVVLTHSVIGTTVNINRAIENSTPANPVTSSNYTFNITSANSNIEQFLELIPDQLSLLADVALNPYGNTGGYTDFFYFDYPAYIQMQLNMPLKFSATDLLLVDTIDNPFTGIELLDPVHGGEFKVRVENKFPLQSDLQLYLLDANHLMTDSLFSNTLVAAAPLDGNNRVTQPQTTDLIIEVSADKIQWLKSSPYIKLKANFNTQPSVAGRLQFYSDYYMLIKVIADLKINIAL